MDELTSTYVTESREQLLAMEDGLLRLESDPADAENLGAIFRAAHTIKGGAGVVECQFIVGFMHKVENLLDRLRNGEIAVGGELASVLLNCCDHVGTLLDALAAGQKQVDAACKARGEALLAQLSDDLLGQLAPATAMPVEHTGEVDTAAAGGNGADAEAWHISVRFGPNVLKKGSDPLSLLDYLASLGEIVSMITVADNIPAAAAMDPECCYLGFEIRFNTRATKAEIEKVFEFVRDDCQLQILPPQAKLGEYIKLIESLPEDSLRLGEILVRSGALTQAELDAGLSRQSAEQANETTAKAPIGELLVEQKVVQKEVVEAAAGKQAAIQEKQAAESRLIRVHADKLDQLIDLVGELVIAGASANLLAQRSNQSELMETTSVLSRLVENIRDSALQLRMVQIGETFNRFNRVVRDTAHEMGKDIQLVITGGETELDKSVVEKLGDPLMHLVRNAIDHGIESVEQRAASGKPRAGKVTLNAYHDSGSIVIEVIDDGGGLSKQRIRQKAIDKGLIEATAQLSEQEIANLIFEAGFSTAEQVTNISGRGVGMDVVRRNIQSLRGTVDVTSEEGVGSTFSIRLPLTLAIIDGFLVGVAHSNFVIPLETVVECLELQGNASDSHYLNLRGEVLPYLRLRDLFEVDGEHPARENIVVIKSGGRKAGIVVDALLGEYQTVIKPLSGLFRHLRGIGGSTILGSGEVALILDVQALVARCAHGEEQRAHAGGRSTEAA